MAKTEREGRCPNGTALLWIAHASSTRTNDCILWPWSKMRITKAGRGGYGRVWMNGRSLGAHCASWIITNGTIPYGLQVLHKCDNRACINPDHIFLGTAKDNTHDMIKKKRNRFGERHPMVKLTAQQVFAIRAASGTFTDIGKQFSVTRHLVAKIKKGILWRSLS